MTYFDDQDLNQFIEDLENGTIHPSIEITRKYHSKSDDPVYIIANVDPRENMIIFNLTLTYSTKTFTSTKIYQSLIRLNNSRSYRKAAEAVERFFQDAKKFSTIDKPYGELEQDFLKRNRDFVLTYQI